MTVTPPFAGTLQVILLLREKAATDALSNRISERVRVGILVIVVLPLPSPSKVAIFPDELGTVTGGPLQLLVSVQAPLVLPVQVALSAWAMAVEPMTMRDRNVDLNGLFIIEFGFS